MGTLTDKFRQFWHDIKAAAHAPEKLDKAMKDGDQTAAVEAIAAVLPQREIYEDRMIRKIGQYSLKPGHDPALLAAMRQTVYANYDRKIQWGFSLDDPENKQREKLRQQTGHRNPHHVYGMAAYMNDVEKMRELKAKGINPDKASDHALTENVISGTARLGLFDAMKEAIHQGASLDKNYGYDDFPPIHAFGKPLFHAFHAGVTDALLETGNPRIISAVKKALGDDVVNEKLKSAQSASTKPAPIRKSTQKLAA